MSTIRIWEEYYTRFELARDAVRPQCEPRLLVHDEPGPNAIVLVHGPDRLSIFHECRRPLFPLVSLKGWGAY